MFIKRLAGGTAILFSMLAGVPDARAQAATIGGDGGRASYLSGKRAASPDERRRHFSAGMAEAKARLDRAPDDPAGLLWMAANLGAEALERGKLAALRVLGQMEALLLRLEAVDPLYDHAAAARTLGRVYHKAPPLISIGSRGKARMYWDRALSRAGDHPANQILAADFFADDGQLARARDLARRYLTHPVAPAENPEANEWSAIAARILAHDDEAQP
jgi:hypothetical protein